MHYPLKIASGQMHFVCLFLASIIIFYMIVSTYFHLVFGLKSYCSLLIAYRYITQTHAVTSFINKTPISNNSLTYYYKIIISFSLNAVWDIHPVPLLLINNNNILLPIIIRLIISTEAFDMSKPTHV